MTKEIYVFDKAAGGITRRRFAKTAIAGTAGLTLLHPLRFAAAQGAPLRIGVVLPLSGFQGLIGQACQVGAELAPGIIADMGGPAVELVYADTETNVDVARTQTERLIRDGVDMIVGAFDSGATGAVAQVCEQNGTPLVINIAADPAITQQGYQYVYRNFPTAPTIVRNGLTAINALFEATGTTPQTAVFMHVNDTFGNAMAGGVNALMPAVGVPYEVLDTISYDPAARDLSVEVSRVRALNPDLVLAVTRLNDAILLVREMVRQRFEPMGFMSPGSPGMYENQFYEALGPYSEYICTAIGWLDLNRPITQELETRFRESQGEAVFEINVGFTFEAIQICADAYARAGSNDAGALVEALAATDIAAEDHPMIGGPIAFDENGQNNNIGASLVQNRERRPRVIWPAEAATMEPVFPMPGWNERT